MPHLRPEPLAGSRTLRVSSSRGQEKRKESSRRIALIKIVKSSAWTGQTAQRVAMEAISHPLCLQEGDADTSFSQGQIVKFHHATSVSSYLGRSAASRFSPTLPTKYLHGFYGSSPQTTFHGRLKDFSEQAVEFTLAPLTHPQPLQHTTPPHPPPPPPRVHEAHVFCFSIPKHSA